MQATGLQPHPLAELFPLMTGADFDALVEDIRANGQREPIVLFEGKILDGRNRYRACSQIGIETIAENYDGQSPQAFVASMNLHRRHLNETQRGMIASRMATLPRGVRVDAARNKDTQICVSPITQIEAAKLLNVAAHTIQDARVVLEKGTPEEIAAADEGRAAVSTIAKAIRQGVPPAQREKDRQTPSHKKGAQPARYEKLRADAQIWGHLRDGLSNLAGLPSAADVAAIARKMDRTKLVDRTILNVSSWLTEFENAWTSGD